MSEWRQSDRSTHAQYYSASTHAQYYSAFSRASVCDGSHAPRSSAKESDLEACNFVSVSIIYIYNEDLICALHEILLRDQIKGDEKGWTHIHKKLADL